LYVEPVTRAHEHSMIAPGTALRMALKAGDSEIAIPRRPS
jgi:hypothetical protein